MAALVTGGAGYIGSHAAHSLAERGETVVVLDNFASGSRRFIPSSAHVVEGSIGDFGLVRRTLSDHRIDAVLHFAGSISVPESMADPLEYYRNNTANSGVLIKACVDSGVNQFIFSSTAAVYGNTDMVPVKETAPTRPLNPYGRSKLMVEWMLTDAARAHRIRHATLRYFNVAGLDAQGRAGQPARQVPHLIKRAAQVALGYAGYLEIFGTDYPTRDGTGIRDYIHVTDLVEAHLLALDHLRNGGDSAVYNCGYGTGSSVLEVITAFERITGKVLPTCKSERRAGDVACVVADSSKLSDKLGWTPQYNSLDLMVKSALDWERDCHAASAQL
jgi:UDP-glucose 4-epimerase